MTISTDASSITSSDGFVERRIVTSGQTGILSGARLAIKDNIEVTGLRYTAGHPHFSERRGQRTATAVERLLAAGAQIVGMTCTDAGGFGVTTPGVINPVDPEIIVGGSSGGSAAAVASGAADIALGTDTAGSVRIPAACTGLFAYKPMYGEVPLSGVWPLASSFDHIGLIAKTRDLLFQSAGVLLGLSDERTEFPGRSSVRIGIEATPPALRSEQVSAAMENTIRSLEASGYGLVAVELPDREATIEAHGIITLAEAARVYQELGAADRTKLGSAAIKALKSAERITCEQVERAHNRLAQIRQTYADAFTSVDLLVVPTLPCAPIDIGKKTAEIRGKMLSVLHAMIYETCSFNAYGAPVMTLPCAPLGGSNHIPFSLQIVGGRDANRHHLSIFRAISADLAIS
jgi:Asp-tRNA(Asn)/Glu-tRNA(Gln) amidotransferase A subunit family amidase